MRRVRAWTARVAGLFGREGRERELAAELESHLALHIADNLRSGMTAEEARRQALIQLGGLERTKQLYRAQRGVPWLENLWLDVCHGARALGRRPGSALGVIVLLSLGMCGRTQGHGLYGEWRIRKFRTLGRGPVCRPPPPRNIAGPGRRAVL